MRNLCVSCQRDVGDAPKCGKYERLQFSDWTIRFDSKEEDEEEKFGFPGVDHSRLELRVDLCAPSVCICHDSTYTICVNYLTSNPSPCRLPLSGTACARGTFTVCSVGSLECSICNGTEMRRCILFLRDPTS